MFTCVHNKCGVSLVATPINPIFSAGCSDCNVEFLRPIYTVRFLLTIVVCDFYSARCSRHGKIVYDFHDIKLHVATIVVGFQNMFQKPTTFFVSYTTIASKL